MCEQEEVGALKIELLKKGSRYCSRWLTILQHTTWVLYEPFSKKNETLQKTSQSILQLQKPILLCAGSITDCEATIAVQILLKRHFFNRVHKEPIHVSVEVSTLPNNILTLTIAAQSSLIQPLSTHPNVFLTIENHFRPCWPFFLIN